MGFILQSDYVFDDLTSQGLDKVPVNARVRVGSITYVLVKEVTSANTTIQQGIDGGYLLVEGRGFIKETKTQWSGYMYELVPANTLLPEGDLRVRIYDDSGNLSCAFTLNILDIDSSGINMLGGLPQEFKITNCSYSYFLKGGSGGYNNTYGAIFLPGFGLMLNTEGIHLSVIDGAYCDKIVVDYKNCNFIPTLTERPNTTPSNTEKIYAIREGGGTWIQDLGCIKPCLRYSWSGGADSSEEFYNFFNGFVVWKDKMNLDMNYFHQLMGSGSFAINNIDARDAVLKNVGANSRLGERLEQQLYSSNGDINEIALITQYALQAF